MSALSALTAALLHSTWQLSVIAVLYVLFRSCTSNPVVRTRAALIALSLQLAWPTLTLVRILHPRGSAVEPEGLADTGWLWIPLLWGAGATVMLARVAAGLIGVRRLLRSAVPVDSALSQRFEALRQRLGVRATALRASRRIDSPITVGFLKPMVLVPAALLTSMPFDTLDLLLAHELMHVRRGDYLLNLVQSCIEALFFFHPAVWWVSRCAREEREHACDDGVLGELGGRMAYARALLSLEQQRQPGGPLTVSSTGGRLMSRIRRVVGQPIPADRLRVARGAVLVLAAVVAVSAFAAQSASKLLPIPEGAKRDLPQLCAAIRKEGCRTELASVDEHDLLTVVLGDLAETRPWLESLIVGLADVAPGEKRAVFKGSISSALGAPWACAELDALWENQRLRCSRD